MTLARSGAALLGGYLAGTLPVADLVARLAHDGRIDLREVGSGNPGTVNAMTALGPGAGLLVMAGDVGKGVAAGMLGRRLAGDAAAHAAAVAAVVGHCYPAWRGFRGGGKGVATSFGQCIATFPAYAPLDLAVGITTASYLRGDRRGRDAFIVSGALWVGAGALWARLRLPNLWGPSPTRALPLANAATFGVILWRFVRARRAGRVDDLHWEGGA